jgi:hypothetical protein
MYGTKHKPASARPQRPEPMKERVMDMDLVTRRVLKQELIETQRRYEEMKEKAERFQHLWGLRNTDIVLLKAEIEKWQELYAPREEGQDPSGITPERARSSWEVCMATCRTLMELVDVLASKYPELREKINDKPVIKNIFDRLRDKDGEIFLGDFSWRANLPEDG